MRIPKLHPSVPPRPRAAVARWPSVEAVLTLSPALATSFLAAVAPVVASLGDVVHSRTSAPDVRPPHRSLTPSARAQALCQSLGLPVEGDLFRRANDVVAAVVRRFHELSLPEVHGVVSPLAPWVAREQMVELLGQVKRRLGTFGPGFVEHAVAEVGSFGRPVAEVYCALSRPQWGAATSEYVREIERFSLRHCDVGVDRALPTKSGPG